MNTILSSNNQWQNKALAQSQNQPPSFKDFVSGGITDEGAQAQVEQMLRSGQISQQQFQRAKDFADLVMKYK